MLADPGIRVYGGNTLAGHRDAEPVSDVDAAAEDFLATRALGGPPGYSAHAARCIGYAQRCVRAPSGFGNDVAEPLNWGFLLQQMGSIASAATNCGSCSGAAGRDCGGYVA